jgi:nucleoid-associated protein YgaU
MRRDTQIGIILGVVILVIIGVFLSTRVSDNKMVLPDLALSEGDRQKTENNEIDINRFFKESKKAEPEETSSKEYSTEKAIVSEEPVEATQPEKQPEITLVETTNEETSMEGKWEGVAEEIVEDPEIAVDQPENMEQEDAVEDVKLAQDIPSVEEAVVPEKQSQTTSYASSTKDFYYKVQSNDNLFKIARKHYGDGQKWTKIFEANRDSMPDSNSLYVGQELLIPDIAAENETSEAVVTPVNGRRDKRSSDVVTHTVQAGDTLYRIAEKYYDNPGVWMKILEANEDTIEDEGSLIKGQILIIPNL